MPLLPAAAAKKKLEPSRRHTGRGRQLQPTAAPTGGTVAAPKGAAATTTPATCELTAENAVEVWNRALSRLSGMAADQARQFDSVAIPAPNRLVIRFKAGYAVCKSACERPEQVARFEQALAEVCGQRIRVEFALAADEAGPSGAESAPARAVPPHQRLLEVMKHPLVHRAGELFGAQPVRVDDPP